MSSKLTKTVFVAIAGTIMAMAASAVTVQAQELPTAAPGEGEMTIISTDCGSGTIDPCGEVEIQQCEYSFGIDINVILKIFKLGGEQKSCRSIGKKPIYKNKYPGQQVVSIVIPEAPTTTYVAPPPSQCSTYERGKGICW